MASDFCVLFNNSFPSPILCRYSLVIYSIKALLFYLSYEIKDRGKQINNKEELDGDREEPT